MPKKNKDLKLVDEFAKEYPDKKAAFLHSIANWFSSEFPFFNVDDHALYLYDQDYYRPFTGSFAKCFMESTLISSGIDIALRSKDYEEIINFLKYKVPRTSQARCRTNVHRILFSDGVFDVRDHKMHEPCMNDFIFSKIDFPLNFDEEQIPSPEARNFIEKFTNNDIEKENYLWELIGYLLSSYQEKMFVIFYGPSNSGKSTLANMVRRICGDSSCVALGIKDFRKPFNIGELQGKRLCIDSDMDETRLNATDISWIKKVTGNDLLQGNQKYQRQFYFQCQAKLLVCTNGKFNLGKNENATPLYERARVFELSDSIPQEEQRYDMDDILDQDRTYL